MIVIPHLGCDVNGKKEEETLHLIVALVGGKYLHIKGARDELLCIIYRSEQQIMKLN